MCSIHAVFPDFDDSSAMGLRFHLRGRVWQVDAPNEQRKLFVAHEYLAFCRIHCRPAKDASLDALRAGP
jgi:hypothetical protein